jgi:transposase-like protein
MASTRNDAYKTFDKTTELYSTKYPKATECLFKDKEEMLAFYDFLAENWTQIRTTTPIESAFATVITENEEK